MVDFADLKELPTRTAIKTRIQRLAQGLEATIDGTFLSPILRVTDWTLGAASERWIEISARVVDAFLSNITTQAVRGFFLEYSTDPGDAGDLSTDQTPRPGWLSALGAGWYGVRRGGATYATGFVTITNSGSTTTAPFKAFDLTFRRATAGSNGGFPTYKNTADGTIYTGLGGTLTLAPGASRTIPIIADQIGSYATAAPGDISVSVNQSFGTLSVTNASPVVGGDREERATYITRCKLQSSAASPNGPADAYRYASTTGADGLPLQLGDGSGATTVNRVYVSPDSSTGAVTIYLANPSGPASATEVSSANGNINGIVIIDDDGTIYNPDPIGVVPDTAIPGPTIADPITGAPGPAAAVAVPIGPPKGTVRIKAVAGLTGGALTTEVHAAIEAAYGSYFETVPIGGLDQVAGAGVVYPSDLQEILGAAYPGLYAPSITSPSGTTAIAEGRVPTYRGPPTISAASDNGSGLVRLTVSSTTGITTGNTIEIYDAVTSGLVISGNWPVTVIDGTHLDLQGSTFTGTFTSASMSLIVLTVV